MTGAAVVAGGMMELPAIMLPAPGEEGGAAITVAEMPEPIVIEEPGMAVWPALAEAGTTPGGFGALLLLELGD